MLNLSHCQSFMQVKTMSAQSLCRLWVICGIACQIGWASCEKTSQTHVGHWSNLHFKSKADPLTLVREKECNPLCGMNESVCGMAENPSLIAMLLGPTFGDDGFQNAPLLIRSSDLVAESSDTSD